MFSFLKSAGSNQGLADALKNNPYLIDVRSTAEFAMGSAAGAVNIPVDILPVRINEVPKDRTIIVFCRSGARSASATQILKNAGYQNVVNGGGVSAVQRAQSAL